MINLNFYHNKRVLVTGHTGFKGSWLVHTLLNFGSKVTGYSLEPSTNPSLFDILNTKNKINSIIGDIRDLNKLKKVFDEVKPEIVFHLAAQPIVLIGYTNPVYTYEVNVMGTINLLECIRLTNSVKSFINVTTDKVYQNNEWYWPYREIDELDGYDPYSNSKSCSELVTKSYQRSFFKDISNKVAISTVRAGNVIGGGDFSPNRILPDALKSVINKNALVIRNPRSIRPYQHVMETILGYLLVAEKQFLNPELNGSYNLGPDEDDCIDTETLIKKFKANWNGYFEYKIIENKGPHEAKFLKLDCSKIKSTFSWKPKWNIDTAVKKVCEWNNTYLYNVSKIENLTLEQIKSFIE